MIKIIQDNIRLLCSEKETSSNNNTNNLGSRLYNNAVKNGGTNLVESVLKLDGKNCRTLNTEDLGIAFKTAADTDQIKDMEDIEKSWKKMGYKKISDSSYLEEYIYNALHTARKDVLKGKDHRIAVVKHIENLSKNCK